MSAGPSSGRPLTTAVVELTGSAKLMLDDASLVVVAGPDKGLEVALDGSTLRLGSSPDCEVVLHDPTISGRHAVVQLGPRGFFVRDLGSKNGLTLEGWRVGEVPLADGMKLTLGATQIAVRAKGGRREIPLGPSGIYHELVARSIPMRAACAALEAAAKREVTVLLEGETGTGKEVAARAVHAASARKDGPFVVFDAGAITPTLAAAELFGHERGAFTGADRAQPGSLEIAEGGTIFLDEIGELPLELQPLLLGALDRRVGRRVGGTKDVTYDVRVVAATNRNLAEEVRAGRFRADLFYRLAVVRVRLPALRDRRADLPLLVQRLAAEARVNVTPELVSILEAHDWPGNVRELRHTLARAALDLAPLEGLGPAPTALHELPLPEARRVAGDAFERRYLEDLIERAGGVLARAAELAGVSRQALTKLVAKHQLRVRDREG